MKVEDVTRLCEKYDLLGLKMSFFKPEDFLAIIDNYFGKYSVNTNRAEVRRVLASECNSILEAHLKTLPRVYGYTFEDNLGQIRRLVAFDSEKQKRDTHTALLFDVKPINQNEGNGG